MKLLIFLHFYQINQSANFSYVGGKAHGNPIYHPENVITEEKTP
jgi:hypothetical protein